MTCSPSPFAPFLFSVFVLSPLSFSLLFVLTFGTHRSQLAQQQTPTNHKPLTTPVFFCQASSTTNTTTSSTTTARPAIIASTTTSGAAATDTASTAATAVAPQPLHRPHNQQKPRSSDARSKLPSTTNSAPRTLASAAAIPNLPDQDQGDRAPLDVQEQSAAQDDSESISEESSISSVDDMEEEESWIASFCNVIGHEYFAEVSEDFIEDDFNLTGLGAVVPM